MDNQICNEPRYMINEIGRRNQRNFNGIKKTKTLKTKFFQKSTKTLINKLFSLNAYENIYLIGH